MKSFNFRSDRKSRLAKFYSWNSSYVSLKKIEKGAFIICELGSSFGGGGGGGLGRVKGVEACRGLAISNFKNKAEAEILKRIDIILCVYNTILCFYVFMFRSGTFVSITLFLCEMLFLKPKRPSVV